MHQPEALQDTFAAMYLNLLFFFLFALLASTPSDILIQTEAEWQKVAARQTLIHKIIRLALEFDELKGVSTGVGLTVIIIRLLPIPLIIWVAWEFWGISPVVLLKHYLNVPN